MSGKKNKKKRQPESPPSKVEVSKEKKKKPTMGEFLQDAVLGTRKPVPVKNAPDHGQKGKIQDHTLPGGSNPGHQESEDSDSSSTGSALDEEEVNKFYDHIESLQEKIGSKQYDQAQFQNDLFLTLGLSSGVDNAWTPAHHHIASDTEYHPLPSVDLDAFFPGLRPCV